MYFMLIVIIIVKKNKIKKKYDISDTMYFKVLVKPAHLFVSLY